MENLKSGGSRYNPVYSVLQENLIKGEFSRLKEQCYLEHAGATLYSEKQMSDVFSDLTTNTYGNPHARSISSKLTEDLIDQIRYEILQHFNTDPEHYTLIFTSGSTASLKLVAEGFQYDNGTFVYLMDNHTSVFGMRECSETSVALSHEDAFEIFSSRKEHHTNNKSNHSNSLFVYPAQCNFSGTKYPLSWIEKVQNGILNNHSTINPSQKWFCMLDAASFVSTSFLDLSRYQPDFVCLSFYKIFGYPTGLGALLVKNSSAYILKRKYFGGGTVFMALSSERIHVPREILYERFEDGTLPFLSIVSLRHGFATLKRLGLRMDVISQHTFRLAQYVFNRLITLHHSNGKPATILYHDTNFEDINCQGGIINFNLLRPSAEFIGYAEVLHIANLYGIHLRTGCFCNPGACQRHLHLTTEDIKNHFNAGHVCGDQNDIIDGYPTGSVRISFGYMSTRKDADTFLNMIEECFVMKPIIKQLPTTWRNLQDAVNQKFKTEISSKNDERLEDLSIDKKLSIRMHNCDINSNSNQKGVLKQMFIYPIKSCAAFSINDSWELTNTGFKFDRQWMVVNANGVCVTQKNDTRLCLIRPKVNLEKDVLEIHFEGVPEINVPLNTLVNSVSSAWPLKCQSKVCGDRIQGWDCGNEVGNWLSEVLGIPGLRLLKQCNNANEINRSSKQERKPQLSLTNQAQFLLINTASVQWLMDCIPKNQFDKDNLQGLINRFRPNFLVDIPQTFIENSYSQIKIGNILFNCDGQCTRCQMICIDQSTGEKSVEPLKTLSKEFNGKISFGVYLSNTVTKCGSNLRINDSVVGLSSTIK